MAVKRWVNARPQYFDGNGLLASGYRLFFYASGSSNKQNTYNSSAGTVANLNPVVLNTLGEPPGEIWLTAGVTYKVGFAVPGSDDPPASFVWTEDVVAGVNDTAAAIDQWISGPAPTFISTTSLSFAGDQTSIFQVGRRIKTANTSGTVYSTISTSSFGTGITTIVVRNDSGVLDSGLSAVSYGILSASGSSIPAGAIPGTTTNDDAPAGYVGEIIESNVSAVNFPTSSQYGDLTSISLTAGDWDVAGLMQAAASGATVTNVEVGISTTSGNSTTGLTIGKNFVAFREPISTSDSTASIPRYRIKLAATTTVYLKYQSTYAAATPKAYGTLTARRVR